MTQTERSLEALQKLNGVNCQLLIHALLAERGILLPSKFRSQEIYLDNGQYFRFVDWMEEKLQEGDIAIFGQKECRNAKKFHLAWFTGEYDENNEPLLTHATIVENSVALWPLSRFFQEKRYQELKAVKRYIIGNFIYIQSVFP